MESSLQITFRGMDATPTLEEKIRHHADRLMRQNQRISNCHVVLDSPHRHHHKGSLFHVHITLTIPGDQIVISRDSDQDHSHEDAYVALRDAFESATRQIEHRLGRKRKSQSALPPPLLNEETADIG